MKAAPGDALKKNRIHFEEIPSTHTYALSNSATLEDRTVITSDFQSEGRGRLGRNWISARGDSLLMSILLKPEISAAAAALITPVMALATCRMVEDLGIPASIRWPNDVMAGDRKIAGILAEAKLDGEKLTHVVTSLGLNLKQTRDALTKIDRPATSVFRETGRQCIPQDLLDPLLVYFWALYDSFLSHGFETIADRWRGKMTLVGEDVLIDLGKTVIEGCVVSFGDDGSIEIRDSSGNSRRFYSGEVTRLNRKTEMSF